MKATTSMRTFANTTVIAVASYPFTGLMVVVALRDHTRRGIDMEIHA